MLQIKSFEFRPGCGSGIEIIDQKINDLAVSLKKQGITQMELKITSTDKVIIYTLIWETPQTHNYTHSPGKSL